VGVVLANVVFLSVGALTSEEALKAWAWRLPFILSVLLIGLGLFIHLKTPDTINPQVMDLNGPDKSPVGEALRRYPIEIALAAGAFVANTLIFYVSITFVLAYGSSPVGLHLPASTMLTALLIAASIQAAAAFLIGRLSDVLGPRRTIMLGALVAVVWAFGLFPLLDTRSPALITLAVSLGLIVAGLMYVPTAALVTGMFDKSVRCSAASLSYQIGAILGGGLAPIVATALLAHYNNGLGVTMYISAACLVTLVSVGLIKEHREARTPRVPY
jgi:MFS family permease